MKRIKDGTKEKIDNTTEKIQYDCMKKIKDGTMKSNQYNTDKIKDGTMR